MKKILIILLLLFSVSIQIAEAQKGEWKTYGFAEGQEIRADYISFLKSNDYYTCRTICRLFASNNDFIRFSRAENFWNSLDANSPDYRANDRKIIFFCYCDDGHLEVNLHLTEDRFDAIEVKNLEWAAPFDNSKVLKTFADEMVKKYKPDAIKWIEKKMGKSIHSMNTKEVCLAALTLHLWLF